MNTREFFIIVLWAGSVPVGLILITAFTLKGIMWRGYWLGILSIQLVVGAAIYFIDSTALTIGRWLIYDFIFSIPNLVMYSIFAMVLESVSWLLDKKGVSHQMYNRSIVGIALGEAFLAIISLVAMPVWGTIYVLDWMRRYWWIFTGVIVLWIAFYLQRDAMCVKMNRSLN